MLFDTDVLIWYLKGNRNAKRIIDNASSINLSVVTYIELVQGMKDKQELSIFRKTLRNWNSSIIYISEEISSRAMFLVEEFYLSHSLQLADALIGATSLQQGSILMTANDRHYHCINGLELEVFRP